MQKNSRNKATSINAITSLITQVIGLVLKFAVQTVFIRVLGQNFLGLNGLFTNVVSFLSFADLGIGTAITVALYRPIAEQNIPLLRRLIFIYQRVYRFIALIMLVCGIAIAPFIYNFINKPAFSRTQVSVWFIIFLISTVATYFSAASRSFLMATQEGYLSSINDFAFKSIQQILQITTIIYLHSFIIFLAIQVLFAVLANIQLAQMAKKKYSDVFRLAQESDPKVPKRIVSSIKKNVVGALSSKIGGIVVVGTDNIILSTFIGLSAVAKYSNYTLIIQSLNSIFSQVIGSAIASIGNLRATSEARHQEEILLRMLYLNAIVNVFLMAGLGSAIDPFIRIWAGTHYVLNSSITLLLLLNFLVSQFRFTSQNFISGFGLYWPLRWKSLIEAGVNLIFSLVFVACLHLGIMSVVLGTLLSNVLVNVWWEPYIVYHYGLKLSMKTYMKEYVSYMFLSVSVLEITYYLSKIIQFTNLLLLLGYIVIVEIVSLGSFLLVTHGNKSFKTLIHLFEKVISKH